MRLCGRLEVDGITVFWKDVQLGLKCNPQIEMELVGMSMKVKCLCLMY